MKRLVLSALLGVALVGMLVWALPAFSAADAPALATAAIVVDGMIDEAYGPPAAVDSNADGHGNAVMNLGELYIAADATNYYFAFTIHADIGATRWGKYVIYIDTTNNASGATSDAWTRSVIVDNPHKPEYGIYSWVDQLPYGPSRTQFWVWSGTKWSQSGAANGAALSAGPVSVIEWQIAKSRLGNPSTIWVEAWATGGGSNDNAQDTINDPPEDWNATDWSTTAHLKCSTRYPGVKLGITFPPDGHYFALPYVDLTGIVSPTAGVTVTVNVNSASFYTPSVEAGGQFTQPITLARGSNVITVTASSASDTTTVVRRVSFGAAHDDTVFWDGLYHNSRDPLYRSSVGAVPTGTPVTLRFRSFANDLTAVKLRVWDDRADMPFVYPMQIVASDIAYDYWEYVIPPQSMPTVLWYRFIAVDGTDTDYYEDDIIAGVYRGYKEGGPGQAFDESPDYSFQLTVYDPAYRTPDWMKNAVVYQIFPDRFRDDDNANNVVSGTHFFYGNSMGGITYTTWNNQVIDPRNPAGPYYNRYSEDFYGGDLQGITARLDYLQSMGVTALYLNPIFLSPSNHKYDTTNFEQVDAHLGGNQALAELLAAAQARGMHVILDGVFNHSSSDSIYFDKYSRYPTVGAYESQASPYYDWYTFNNWPDDYQSWWGYDTLPVLRSANPAVRSYFYSGTNPIGVRWVMSGTAGWRMDVGGDIDPGLTRNPANDYWEGFRAAVKRANPQAVIIGEEWGDATPWLLGNEWDAVMNYRFRSALLSFMRNRHYEDNDNNSGSSGGVLDPIKPSQLDAWLRSIQEDYPPQAWQAMMNLMGSHDTNRLRFVLSKAQKADSSHDPYDPTADLSPDEVDVYQKLLAVLQFTLPGAPTVYYGDEVGLDSPGRWYNNKWEDDPYNRVPFPWDDTPGDYSQRAEVAARYTLLGQTRAAHPALRTGSFDTLLTDDSRMVYVYGRKWISGTLSDAAVIVINRDVATHTIVVNVNNYLGEGVVLNDVLDSGQPYTVTAGYITVADLAPMEGALLVLAGGDVTPPPPPMNLTAAAGQSQVVLTWDAVTDAASYNVYRSLFSGGGYTRIVTGAAATLYTDTAVINGRRYYYVVTAVDAADNESGYSNEAAALPHYVIDWANLDRPAEITTTLGITPTEPIYGRVVISGVTGLPGATEGLLAQVGFGLTATPPVSWTWWTAAAFNADVGNNDEFSATLLPELVGEFYYLYRYSTTGGEEWVYADQSGLVAPTAVVSPGLLYVQPSGDTTPPDAPPNLRVVHWGTDHITVQWDAVSAADLYAYDLYRWGEGQTLSDALRLARIWPPTTVYTDDAVMVNRAYTYTVQALDTSFNRSEFSNYATGIAVQRLLSLTFSVQVPGFTPLDDTVYIAGDNAQVFGASWDPNRRPLNRVDATHWIITLTAPEDTKLQYKYTRGNWDRVEKWGALTGYANRSVTTAYGATGAMTVTDTVYNWRDPLVVSVNPPHGATAWDANTFITATFNRGLAPASVTTATVLVTANGAPLAGSLSYISPTVYFSPAAPLALPGQYMVTLTTGIRDGEDNISLQKAFRWSFGALPDLSTSVKLVSATQVEPGGLVTYTLVLSNTGNADAAVRYTDTLPAVLDWVSGKLTDTVVVSAGHTAPVTITARVNVEASDGITFENTATINDGFHVVLLRSPATTVHVAPVFRIYLPVVLRNF